MHISYSQMVANLVLIVSETSNPIKRNFLFLESFLEFNDEPVADARARNVRRFVSHCIVKSDKILGNGSGSLSAFGMDTTLDGTGNQWQFRG